jgi:hypothetical protein
MRLFLCSESDSVLISYGSTRVLRFPLLATVPTAQRSGGVIFASFPAFGLGDDGHIAQPSQVRYPSDIGYLLRASIMAKRH